MKFRKIESQKRPSFPPTEERPKKGRTFKILFLFLLVLVVAAGLVYWLWNREWILTTGRIVAAQVNVASPMTGRVASLFIEEGDEVESGQLLARLSDEEIQADLRRAEAKLEGARSRLEARQATGIDPAVKAKVEAANRDLNLAKEQYEIALAGSEKTESKRQRARVVAERAERLFLLKATTRDDYEEAASEWRESVSEHTAAQAGLAETDAAIRGARKLLEKARESLQYAEKEFAEELELLRIDIEEAEAEVDRVKSRLDQTFIYSPIAGLVSWTPKAVGEVVDHNDTLVTLLDPEKVWVEAYVRGSDLSGLHENTEARVKVDGMQEEVFRGKVSLYYPRTAPPDETLNIGPERARSPSRLPRLVHPVKIVFDGEIPPGVRPGMITRVRIARR